MDLLRSRRRPVTAAYLAERLAVSVRTVYRDVQSLIDLGAGIEGSAGLGYVIRSGFFLPPLMFADEEIEALVLGARWVQSQPDASLAMAADSALAKIATSAARDLRERIAEIGLWAPRLKERREKPRDLGIVRIAIREERKLRIDYADARNQQTSRVIWPLGLGFFDGTRMLAAWCELRSDFRHFRVDRISGIERLATPFPTARRVLVSTWRRQHLDRDTRP